jgi:hypothetical protein
MYYQCYLTHDVDDVVYQAPEGYIIEGYVNVVNSSSHGSSSVTISPDQKTLSIHAEANGKICFEDTFGCVDCPDEWQKWSGTARRQVQVNLVSTEPTRKVGEEQALMITTRGLCCCKGYLRPGLWDGRDYIIAVSRIPKDFQIGRHVARNPAFTSVALQTPRGDTAVELRSQYTHAADDKTGLCAECQPPAATAKDSSTPRVTIRQANQLSDYIKTETIRTVNNPMIEPKSFLETEYFARQLELELLRLKHGRNLLREPIAADLPEKVRYELAKHFRRDTKDVRRQDLLSLRNADLARITGITEDDAQRIRLQTLGVQFNEKSTRKSPT